MVEGFCLARYLRMPFVRAWFGPGSGLVPAWFWLVRAWFRGLIQACRPPPPSSCPPLKPSHVSHAHSPAEPSPKLWKALFLMVSQLERGPDSPHSPAAEAPARNTQ